VITRVGVEFFLLRSFSNCLNHFHILCSGMTRNLAILLIALTVSVVSAGSGSMMVSFYNSTATTCSGTPVISQTVSLSTVTTAAYAGGGNTANASVACTQIGTGNNTLFIIAFCYDITGEPNNAGLWEGYYNVYNDSKCSFYLGTNYASWNTQATSNTPSSCVAAISPSGTSVIYGNFTCSSYGTGYGTVVNVSVFSVFLTALIASFISL